MHIFPNLLLILFSPCTQVQERYLKQPTIAPFFTVLILKFSTKITVTRISNSKHKSLRFEATKHNFRVSEQQQCLKKSFLKLRVLKGTVKATLFTSEVGKWTVRPSKAMFYSGRNHFAFVSQFWSDCRLELVFPFTCDIHKFRSLLS